jgi:rubrerythrin
MTTRKPAGTARKSAVAKQPPVAKKTPVGKKRAMPASRVQATPATARAGKADGSVGSVHDLMAYAYALEAEAAERYAEFAEAMENHNNREVAELFRKLARIEHRHSEQVLEEMGWSSPPQPPAGGYRWEGPEGHESGDISDLHYLMQPHHALTIARHNEQRAEQFFLLLAKKAPTAGVRRAAREMAAEETEHVRLIEEWLKRTPAPDPNWAFDPDPPVLSD